MLFIFSLANSNLSSHFWGIYCFFYIFLKLDSTFQPLPLPEKSIRVLWNPSAALLYRVNHFPQFWSHMMNYLGTVFISVKISQRVFSSFIRFPYLFVYVSFFSFFVSLLCVFVASPEGSGLYFRKVEIFMSNLTFCVHILSAPRYSYPREWGSSVTAHSGRLSIFLCHDHKMSYLCGLLINYLICLSLSSYVYKSSCYQFMHVVSIIASTSWLLYCGPHFGECTWRACSEICNPEYYPCTLSLGLLQ